MCGICGFSVKNSVLTKSTLKRMNNTLIHRGPDDEGYYFNSDVGLAMRRLSIIDLKNGSQPIFNEDKTICIVYNGELYNYLELRDKLISKGHVFKTKSDTETIIHAYEEYGEDCLNYFRGMFVFAIYNIKLKKIFIARDRLGIKPLYYFVNKDKIIFASEIKAILASGVVKKEIDSQAMDLYFTYTYIPAPYSIFKNIKKLLPGHYLIYENYKLIIRKYWDIENIEKKNISENRWIDKINRKFRSVIKDHLISDVPVGSFLSGGVDSAFVTSIAQEEINSPINTFTMGFKSNNNSLIDERIFAKKLAKGKGFQYNEFLVKPNFKKIAKEIVRAFDEPFADDSVIPSYYISALTSKVVKVSLSGLGGDELFGGYYRYIGFKLSLAYKFVPNWLHYKIIQPLINMLPEQKSGKDRIDHIKRFVDAAKMKPIDRYIQYISSLSLEDKKELYNSDTYKKINLEETKNLIINYFNSYQSEDIMDKIYYIDIKTYLPDDILALSDRLSMKHSLELRVPFVDHKFLEMTMSIPNRFKIRNFSGKYILKKAAKTILPRYILSHKKQGFESPMASWLKYELKDYMFSVINKESVEKLGLFNYNFIQKKIDEHFNGVKKNNKFLFSLLIFFIWYDEYME